MKLRKIALWIIPLIVVLGAGVFVYQTYFNNNSTSHSGGPTNKVALTAFNQKESELTNQSVGIYKQIQEDYAQLENGSMTPQKFKHAMMPLKDQMKANWDEYNKYTNENGLSSSDRQSDAFRAGVELASSIRLDEYTFLINVTQYDLSQKQIEDKFKTNLSNFDAKLQQYKNVTKDIH